MTETKLYMLEYPFEGGRYSIEVAATSWDDARAHLDAIKAWGRIGGEIHDIIPVRPGLGWLARLRVEILMWWRTRA